MAIILQGKVNEYTGIIDDAMMFAGYSLFWTGISVGFSNLFCGYLLVDVEFVWGFLEVGVPLLMLRTRSPLLRFWWLKSLVVRWDFLESLSALFSAVMEPSPKIDSQLHINSIINSSFIILQPITFQSFFL